MKIILKGGDKNLNEKEVNVKIEDVKLLSAAEANKIIADSIKDRIYQESINNL